jgi:hypothetical protein
VTLVLLDLDGNPVGALPPVDIELPWTTDIVPIIGFARDRFGLDVQVLRLLSADPPPDGAVSYLAQLATTAPARVPAATPVEIDLSDDRRRAPYARPGGPAATLAWACDAVERLGRGPVLGIDQRRTWNLSAIWRMRTADAPLWIKQVPHFFGHEPAVLRWLAGTDQAANFPAQLTSDAGRMLLEDIPGEDLHGAPIAVRQAIAARLHPTQLAAAQQVAALLEAGVPDRRLLRLRPSLEAVAGDDARRASPDLDRLVGGLADRFAAVAECGLPDTLVHGDLHPGNVRAAGDGPQVIIDWGDSFIGNPAFDILRLVERLPAEDASPVIDAWAAHWRSDVPGCDPRRAADLLRPVAALRLASVYVDFLANIEPSEYVYHEDDPAMCLAEAAGFAAAELAAA